MLVKIYINISQKIMVLKVGENYLFRMLITSSKIYKEASVAQLLCHSTCKAWVEGWITVFSSLLDETHKLRSRLHMTLAVGGTLNPKSNKQNLQNNECFFNIFQGLNKFNSSEW